jgi:acylphosphatase
VICSTAPPERDRRIVTGDAPAELRYRVIISGRVQGVRFRDSCQREALRNGVAGWVHNLVDGTVEAVFEGPAAAAEHLIAWCHDGPPLAVVTDVKVMAEPLTGASGFELRG